MTALASTRYAPPSSRRLLARVLDDPGLVAAIQHLPAPTLARLIDHVGLEDAGELIALATTAQLELVFDEDLWRSAGPGRDEAFDAARFLTWLEVMLEAGAASCARRLAELSEDLLVHALHLHLLVLDLDALAAEMAGLGDDLDQVEKRLEDRLYLELDSYRLVARGHDGWDALTAALLALDEQHHDLLVRVLDRCAYLAARDLDDAGGLVEVLSAEDTLATDVAAAREDRRSRAGYVAPSAAAAFLKLAARAESNGGRDPITRAYFRELAPSRARPASELDPAPADRLTRLLREQGVLDGDPAPAQLGAGAPGPASPDTAADQLRAALAGLSDDDPARHELRMAELVYLANVLVAGGEVDGRALRPAEAAIVALRTCGAGLADLIATTGQSAAATVTREPADRLFRIGWRLHHTPRARPPG